MEKDNNQSSLERRIAPRLPLQIKFKYRILSPTQESNVFNETTTKNISYSGLLFENKEQIPIDTELKIILEMPGLAPKILEVEGKVFRVEKTSTLNFDIGISFINISEKQEGEIKKRIESLNLIKLLEGIDKKEVSDLHLTAYSSAMVRIYGKIRPLNDRILSGEEIKQMIYSILTEKQKRQFEADKDLDFSFSPRIDSRYRVSIYQQRGTTEVVFRNIMPNIRSREELGLPEVIEDLCQLKDGIVILAGATGAGKTTTITTMIDIINKARGGVILALEKPIEYLHKNIKAIVKQREVGIDVSTFAAGLKAALKQDADVIVVGEILDSDTIETALQAAETSHLVITCIHATDTVQVLDRIISLFTAEQRNFICSRLSHCLKAICIQQLLPHKSGTERVLATEVCIVTNAIRRLISSINFSQIPSVIQTGAEYKMQTIRNSIDNLFGQGLISAETYEMYTKKL